MNSFPIQRPPMWAASAAVVLAVVGLSACSITMPNPRPEPVVAEQWQAPLPHTGVVADLSQWWRSLGDPVLVEFIEAAQAVSPGVAQALARVEAARATQVQAGAVLQPQVNAQLAAQRGVSQPAVPATTAYTAGVQAAWELDLVGANRAVQRASQAQVQSTQALWHDARVSVAAEVANVYFAERHCRAVLAIARQDAASRMQTARLVGITADAGLSAKADVALAQAAAADSASRAKQQATSCAINTKALVALTGLSEKVVQQKLDEAMDKPQASLPEPVPFAIPSLPAQTIAQRPDVFAAERDVLVASAQVGSAKAQRYPRLTLNGSIGALRTITDGVQSDLQTWSVGPLALTLPLFDGGQRVANIAAAQAQYDQAVSVYQARVRNAVREVEESLLALDSAAERQPELDKASANWEQLFQATDTRYRQGLASRVELEDARRQWLASQSAQRTLELERWRAWVALYRAAGGGFEIPRNEQDKQPKP